MRKKSLKVLYLGIGIIISTLGTNVFAETAVSAGARDVSATLPLQKKENEVTTIQAPTATSVQTPVQVSDPNSAQTSTQLKIGKTTLPPSPGGGGEPDVPGTTPTPVPEDTQFGILFAPTIFDFGMTPDNFQLGNEIHKSLIADQYVGIGDTRQDAPGWVLTAQATILKNGDSPLTGDISMDPSVKHVSYDGKNYHLDDNIPAASVPQTPMTPHTSDLILGGSSVTIMNAKKGSGSGMWAADLSNVTLNASETSNLTTGTYTGSVTWDLGNAPVGN